MLQDWLSVLQKGVQDSLDFVQQSKNGILFAVLVLLFTLVWLWKKHGWKDAMKNLWRTVGEGLVITIVAWMAVLCVHLIYEPFHLQYDEKARTSRAAATLDTESHKLLLCGANLNGANEKNDLLGRQVTAQQTQVAGQQTLIAGQQATSAKQQSTFDLCVTTLAKENAPIPLKMTMLMAENPRANPEAKHTTLLFLLTNKPVTLVRLT